MDYEDFDLEVTAASGGGYILSVTSPAGDAKGKMKFPYGQLDYYPTSAGGSNVLAMTDIQFQSR